MRPGEDGEVAALLNRLREAPSDADNRTLMTRANIMANKNDMPTPMKVPMAVPRLFCLKKAIDEYNLRDLAMLGEPILCKAHDIIGDRTKTCKAGDIANKSMVSATVKNQTCKQAMNNSYTTLTLALDAAVELTVNLNVLDLLSNSAVGYLRRGGKDVHGRPNVLWIEFARPEVGLQHLQENAHLRTRHTCRTINALSTPIGPKRTNFTYKGWNIVHTQVQVYIPAARTRHRFQGASNTALLADLSGHARQRRATTGMHYTVFSRVC
jgi:hypothetical protein